MAALPELRVPLDFPQPACRPDIPSDVPIDVQANEEVAAAVLMSTDTQPASASSTWQPPVGRSAQISQAAERKTSLDRQHSRRDSGDSVAKTGVKNGTHGSADSRSSGHSHLPRHSSHTSAKKRSRSSAHRNRGRKSSPLPSNSRSRKNESMAHEADRGSNHKSCREAEPTRNAAEKRTRIVLQIYEEILNNGAVVDSKLKETEFITSAGSIPWPPLLPAADGAEISQSLQSASSEIIRNRSNFTPPQQPVVPEKSRHQGKGLKPDAGQKRSSHKSPDPAGKKLKRETKRESTNDNDEDRRIEMASTLLSLQMESPVKKVERQDNFDDVIFRPLKEGNSVMAKWTDKNFYAGNLASNLGDGRWHVLFEDGGKKAVNESDIISVPHLSIGQVVMATFSDGSLCLKGLVKQPLYEKNRLFYHVEYNDGVKNVTEKFSRRDVFLTAELAAALLNKQSKGSDKLTKFADVDLNNIIPKRSRLSALTKALDGSTDDSETDSTSSWKNLSKNRKPIQLKLSTSNNSSSSATSKAFLKSPVERKQAPSHTQCSEESLSHSIPTPTDAVTPLPKAMPAPENPQDLLGPLPEEGSTLFAGITFLLTTADAGNASDTATDSHSGRSSALFDIPHLIRQIESGGGCVHQTLENAQESTGCKEIVLLAYTYLRTVKYMQCLAAGIPCIMHTWLIDCCRRKELLSKNDYLLPSGYSIITNSLITDRSVFSKSCSLFNGVRFMLVSKNPRHAESWTSVLTAARAVVVDDFPSSSSTATRKASNSVDVIISDSTCPAHVIKKAQQMKIPIVSSEYVVQCLINGRRLSCEAHEKFGISNK